MDNDHSFILFLLWCFVFLHVLLNHDWLWGIFASAKNSTRISKPREMKIKSEKDCPHCQNQQEEVVSKPGDPPAWDTIKGKGG